MYGSTIIRTLCLFTTLLSLAFAGNALAFQDENDLTVDRAETDNYWDFHTKDDGITIWEDGSGPDGTGEGVSTYEDDPAAQPQESTYQAPAGEGMLSEEVIPGSGQTAFTPKQHRRSKDARTFATGTVIKVREAYKLSSDPVLSNVPTLFQAIQSLHVQLSGFCPRGWDKREEWHKPNQGYYFVHFSARCH